MVDSGKGVCGPERGDCDLRQSASVSSTLVYGAAFASAMVIADGLSRAEAQTAITDIDLLNLLLNLEYLQAQFYSSAAGSTSLAAADIAGTGIPGAAVGGRATQFSDPIIAQHAREMATVAVAHLRYMREQLIINGGLAVAQPAIDISADQSGH
jgi:hypothetical protein